MSATKASESTPDAHGSGLTSQPLNPLRYDGHVAEPGEVAMMLASEVPSRARVLDVGCGTGSVSQIIKDQCNADIVGVEPDTLRAEVARDRGLVVYDDFLSGELLQELGSFDVILFADVLEHLANPGEMLRLVHGSLRTNGRLVASVPNVAHWSVRISLLFGQFNYAPVGIMDATHLRWFTADSLETLFAAQRYQVERLQHTAGINLPVYWRFPWRAIPRKSILGPLLRSLTRLQPRLFGCQHVVTATPQY